MQPIAARPGIIASAGVRDLLVLHSQIMDELRDRGILRTGNGPAGDYAEKLFESAFGWTLTANSKEGYDAVGDGVRYQIKSRRIATRTGSRQLGALRRLPEQTFDMLAAILFDGSYGVSRAILIPHAVVVGRARRTEHTNSWRFMLDDGVWRLDGVQDVTSEIQSAQIEI